MKLFVLLATVAFAEALTSAQEARAKQVYGKWDSNHNGDLTSGGVYGALSELDSKLTEAQLQKAAGHNKKKVTLKQFLDIYAKLEGSGNTGKGKFPKGCKNWFDGCNHCIIKDGKELGCTKMYCGQMYGGAKKKAFCTVFEDGRRCKSATDCNSAQTYNCFTREVWTAAKKAYCCKTRKMGCPQKPKSKALKDGSVCYAFYESNPAAAVNRKNDCPKGYKCAAKSNMMSFNSVMTCQKASSSKGKGKGKTSIPAGCVSWFDGCNTCFVRNGQTLGCTMMACLTQGTPKCTRFGPSEVGVAQLD